MTRKLLSSNTTQLAHHCIIYLKHIEKETNFHRIGRNEMMLNGKMFDVIKEERKGDFTIFNCIQDSREDTLLLIISKVKNDQHDSSLSGFVINLDLPISGYAINSLYSTKREFAPIASIRLNSINQLPVSPPPEKS